MCTDRSQQEGAFDKGEDGDDGLYPAEREDDSECEHPDEDRNHVRWSADVIRKYCQCQQLLCPLKVYYDLDCASLKMSCSSEVTYWDTIASLTIYASWSDA